MNLAAIGGRIVVSTVLGLALAGCAPNGSSGGSPGGAAKMAPTVTAKKATAYVVTVDSPYYKNGPAQPMPPDGTFRKGTEVTVIKSLGSYDLVQAKDGTKAYVAKASLAPAPIR